MGQTPSKKSEESGESLRAQARILTEQRTKLRQQAQAAYNAGDHSLAATLSARARALEDERASINTRAALLIFADLNPNYPTDPAPRPATTSWFRRLWGGSGGGGGGDGVAATAMNLARVDLHGLFVAEAEQRVHRHLELCEKVGVARTVIITGKGLHSRDGVAKLRPAVEKLLRDVEGWRVVVGKNAGAFEVKRVVGGGDGVEGVVGVVGAVWGWVRARVGGGGVVARERRD